MTPVVDKSASKNYCKKYPNGEPVKTRVNRIKEQKEKSTWSHKILHCSLLKMQFQNGRVGLDWKTVELNARHLHLATIKDDFAHQERVGYLIVVVQMHFI